MFIGWDDWCNFSLSLHIHGKVVGTCVPIASRVQNPFLVGIICFGIYYMWLYHWPSYKSGMISPLNLKYFCLFYCNIPPSMLYKHIFMRNMLLSNRMVSLVLISIEFITDKANLVSLRVVYLNTGASHSLLNAYSRQCLAKLPTALRLQVAR